MLIGFHDVIAARPHIDDVDVLERSEQDQGLRIALEMWRPKNWWGTGISGDDLLVMSQDTGIPLAHVPRSGVVGQVYVAQSQTERLDVLVHNEPLIVEDCERLLDACIHDSLADRAPLAIAAVDAWREGHTAAATALAAILCDPLAKLAIRGGVLGFDNKADAARWDNLTARGGYNSLAKAAGLGDEQSPHVFVKRAVVAPITQFFANWDSESSQPAPDTLSRHVFAHDANLAHFTRSNGLLALMLVTSLLFELEEWAEEVEMMDQDRED